MIEIGFFEDGRKVLCIEIEDEHQRRLVFEAREFGDRYRDALRKYVGVVKKK